MEVMHAAIGNVSNVVKGYPVLSGICAVVSILPFFRLYFKLTSGICDCTTDMTGKTVVVTGANSGIGKYTAMELARKGARVIMGCRNKEKGQKVLDEIVRETGNHEVVLKELDLCSFASVRTFAEEILKTERNLHVLINNAGIIGPVKREVTVDGCEKTMQANHLGHFLLTLLLIDTLKKSAPSRIINVSSEAHKYVKLDIRDLNFTAQRYNDLTAYGRSKLANILFTRELTKRLRGTGVTANSLHPGIVQSELFRPGTNFLIRKMVKYNILCHKKTPLEGAQTTIHLAVSPELNNVSGKYFTDCKQGEPSLSGRSDEDAAELWKASEELVGLDKKILK